MSSKEEHTRAVLAAVLMLDDGTRRRTVIESLSDNHSVTVRTAARWIAEAERIRFERDCDVGSDTQSVRQRLTERAWKRATVIHEKSLTCLSQDDELENGERETCIVERGARLAATALKHEQVIGTYYHLDKIAPDYDLASDDTRDVVSRAVAQNAEAFDTPQLLQIANAVTSALDRRPYLHEEQHREARVSEKVQALLDLKADGPN